MDKISDLLSQNPISSDDIVEIHTNPSNHSVQEFNVAIQKLVAENEELKNKNKYLEQTLATFQNPSPAAELKVYCGLQEELAVKNNTIRKLEYDIKRLNEIISRENLPKI